MFHSHCTVHCRLTCADLALRNDSKYITHPNLAQYVDVVRGRASRLGVVCEHYELRLLDFLQHRHRDGLQQQRVWGDARHPRRSGEIGGAGQGSGAGRAAEVFGSDGD